MLNEVVFKVRWEEDLGVGPVGEYLEVVDFDPASGCFYAPVDLNSPGLLAQDGLSPSEGNPQFHQQMVYAVAMITIANFERALGRKALWSPRVIRPGWTTEDSIAPAETEAAPQTDAKDGKKSPAGKAAAAARTYQFFRPATSMDGCIKCNAQSGWGYEYVPRLRLYPHAMRQANAYYSPQKKALLFGYFPASENAPGSHYPGGIVFTALSHDVVAHEVTHALLDGMHRRFVEDTHPDGLAFHEAFADIVALFQHFTFPEVLRQQIGRTRGDLASQSLLGQLAHQFGQAIGSHGALRDALGQVDSETGRWEPQRPNPDDYLNVREPHARGAILVAAVFDAFLSIYGSRVSDLFRIATGGTGVLGSGSLHPDLVNRLASEAAKAARHVLNMCIRALDYCPPVDITFGDYLRALVTADYELVRDDDRGYRLAFIEAFRRRGIYPRDLRTLSEDTLRWSAQAEEVKCDLEPLCEVLRDFVQRNTYITAENQEPDWWAGMGGNQSPAWSTLSERERIFWTMEHYGMLLNRRINAKLYAGEREAFARLTGLFLSTRNPPQGLRPGARGPRFEVHSIRPAVRVGPDGDLLSEVIICITQSRKVPLDPEAQPSSAWYESTSDMDGNSEIPGFTFRGGCTLILDLESQQLRYAVVKRIDSENRLRRQRTYRSGGESPGLRMTYFGSVQDDIEPFALLHATHQAEP
ncbi:MAG TPA: hypothetical protein VF665_14455 [Longimicrobium sp.]|uniref:hypothetical protein n=1 Tax=Longimicrobium sp. TaxID=2029185 RepID=UPI002ED7F566